MGLPPLRQRKRKTGRVPRGLPHDPLPHPEPYLAQSRPGEMDICRVELLGVAARRREERARRRNADDLTRFLRDIDLDRRHRVGHGQSS